MKGNIHSTLCNVRRNSDFQENGTTYNLKSRAFKAALFTTCMGFAGIDKPVPHSACAEDLLAFHIDRTPCSGGRICRRTSGIPASRCTCQSPPAVESQADLILQTGVSVDGLE